jgi:outer membrane protein OmpA-like peptidoglycan-associated protein
MNALQQGENYPMTIERNCGLAVGRHLKLALAGLVVMSLFACAQQAPPPQTAAAAPPVVPVPFDVAVTKAATTVLSTAPVQAGGRQMVVIDPLVDGVIGVQTAATQQIGARIVALAKQSYPQFDVVPFTPENVAKAPYVMVGTFTPVNAQGMTAGDREAFRFCLVMADLKTGKTVAKGVARALPAGVDSTPSGFFQESPAWTEDPSVKGYVATCQATKVGDPISKVYLDGIVTASMVSDAIDAYNAGRYREALGLYRSAEGQPAGKQLRVYNGIYLTDWKLGRKVEAADDFGHLVDYGLDHDRLAVKLLFRPGSTGFEETSATGSYDMWLRQIAARSAAHTACLQVTGHTSKSGSPVLNDRLSLVRAEFVRDRLQGDEPGLRNRVIADGAGSKENLVGTGADNESDALDRRVEFKPIPKC